MASREKGLARRALALDAALAWRPGIPPHSLLQGAARHWMSHHFHQLERTVPAFQRDTSHADHDSIFFMAQFAETVSLD
jgi:hypothetical protein